MIPPAVLRLGPTRQVLRLAAAAIIAGALAFTSGARAASAAPPDILLQAPLVGQRFTPPDSADSGSWDCLPASLTMAISILDQSPADYGSVRRYMRTQSGIRLFGLGQTYGVVEYSTGGRFSADKTYRPAAPDSWRTLLEGELSQGRPLVLYIADASKLEDSAGQAPRPANESFPDAHAVLAVGLLNGGATVVIDDPWNATPGGPGRQFQMTADAFAAAWGNTRFSGGVVYSNAGWNYIGFQPTSTTGVPPEPTAPPVVEPTAPSAVEPTPPPTDTPVPAAPPPSPTSVAAAITCMYTTDNCPMGWIPVTVSWSAPAGPITRFQVYYNPGTLNIQCTGTTWTATGPPELVGTVGPDASNWSGQLEMTAQGGKYSVVAVNDAGSSAAAMSDWVELVDDVVCE